MDNNGHLEETEVMVLPPVEQEGVVSVFGKDIIPERTGRLGYALRVSPEPFRRPAHPPLHQPAEVELGGVGAAR